MHKNAAFFKLGLLPAILIFIMIAFEPPGISLPSLCAAAIHECGHLAAAGMLGISLRSLDIGPLGATIHTRSLLISYGSEILLCAAGPIANIFCACATYLLFGTTKSFLGGKAAFGFFAVSLFLGVLNLLPIEGFDGGRILSAVIGRAAGPRVAAGVVSVMSVLSLILLWMLSVYLLLRWGASLSLFIFAASVFCRVFIEGDDTRAHGK